MPIAIIAHPLSPPVFFSQAVLCRSIEYFIRSKGMAHKCNFITQLLIFLCFTHVLSSITAAPTTRSRKISQEDLPSQNLLDEGVLDLGEGFVEGRMDLETNDYSEVGANPVHDPKPPGRI
ncbi:hypothetical protein D8674_010861 [Pyrus ussuriensis x Pyrus communis]|uniref:Uncharacterized protein n=1 Tax=Pyrus ussuriensis x Pyrus communis TaxID=2448454 RepID=A0A5N5FX89_9ROSA|nr:hypothetical protein D8674_010861 [Pyrus ussuriensis x Pyrus communis]